MKKSTLISLSISASIAVLAAGVASCIIIALLLCGTAPALAQTTPSTPRQELLKTNRGSVTLARAQTAKQQCINTCRARYRDCRRLNQLPSFECRDVYQDCTRYTCTGLGPG